MSLPDLERGGPPPGTVVETAPARARSGAGAGAAPAPRDRRGWTVALLWLGFGGLLVAVGAYRPGGLPMAVRVASVLVGVAVAYQGARRVGRGVFGLRFDAGQWLAVSWLGLVIVTAVSAPLLPLGEHRDTSATLRELPFQRPDLFGDHALGTNNFGLDQLARVVYGARASLTVALVAVVVGIVVGGAIGIVSGYWRGPIDRGIGVLNNTLLAFPPLVLLLALSAVLDPSVRTLTIGLSILSIPINVRLARAAAMQVAQREFVQAARAMGATRRRIVVRELVPSVLPTLLAYGMIVVAVMIVAEASLSFLGLGIKQPEPSWGNMIAEGQQGVFEANPHIVLGPGIVLFLTVFSFNLIGEKLQARWDPRGGPS